MTAFFVPGLAPGTATKRAYDGHTVLAIFAGRDGYTIGWSGGCATVTRRETYEAIPFD